MHTADVHTLEACIPQDVLSSSGLEPAPPEFGSYHYTGRIEGHTLVKVYPNGRASAVLFS